MNKCSSCRHWRELPSSRFGVCEEILKIIHTGTPTDVHRDDAIILTDSVDAYVGRNFGCDHWTNKYTPVKNVKVNDGNLD